MAAGRQRRRRARVLLIRAPPVRLTRSGVPHMLRSAVCAAAVLALALPLSADVPKDKGDPQGKDPAKKKEADGPLSRAELARRLQTTIDMRDFQQPMSLKECFALVMEKMHGRFGEDGLPILVDPEAFKQEDPDAPD